MKICSKEKRMWIIKVKFLRECCRPMKILRKRIINWQWNSNKCKTPKSKICKRKCEIRRANLKCWRKCFVVRRCSLRAKTTKSWDSRRRLIGWLKKAMLKKCKLTSLIGQITTICNSITVILIINKEALRLKMLMKVPIRVRLQMTTTMILMKKKISMITKI